MSATFGVSGCPAPERVTRTVSAARSAVTEPGAVLQSSPPSARRRGPGHALDLLLGSLSESTHRKHTPTSGCPPGGADCRRRCGRRNTNSPAARVVRRRRPPAGFVMMAGEAALYGGVAGGAREWRARSEDAGAGPPRRVGRRRWRSPVLRGADRRRRERGGDGRRDRRRADRRPSHRRAPPRGRGGPEAGLGARLRHRRHRTSIRRVRPA